MVKDKSKRLTLAEQLETEQELLKLSAVLNKGFIPSEFSKVVRSTMRKKHLTSIHYVRQLGENWNYGMWLRLIEGTWSPGTARLREICEVMDLDFDCMKMIVDEDRRTAPERRKNWIGAKVQ